MADHDPGPDGDPGVNFSAAYMVDHDPGPDGDPGVNFSAAYSYCVTFSAGIGCPPQQGQRASVVAIIRATFWRIVATESGTCRCIRVGRAPRDVAFG